MGTKKNSTSKQPIQLVHLTPAELRALPRPHTGFEPYTEKLLDLYEANEAGLHVVGIDVAETREALRIDAALAPEEAALKEQLERIQNTRLLYRSKAWSTTMKVYDRARSAGHTDVDVARELIGMAAFMKQRARRKKTPPTGGTGGSGNS